MDRTTSLKLNLRCAGIIIAAAAASCQRYEAFRYRLVGPREYVVPQDQIPTVDQWIDPTHIPVSTALPGVSIETVYAPTGVVPSPEALRVTHGSDCFQLVSLSQLRGMVRISNPSQALEFVRLRTSISEEYCWDKPVLEVAKDETAVTSKPSKTGTGDTHLYSASGFDAILSPQAYRLGGFQPPIVHTVGKHFEIVRWVCVVRGLEGQRIQRWKEIVSPDGDYRLTILVSRPIPELPATDWGIQGRA